MIETGTNTESGSSLPQGGKRSYLISVEEDTGSGYRPSVPAPSSPVIL